VDVRRFICRDDQERQWLLEMHDRLLPKVFQATACFTGVMVAMLPWVSPTMFAPIAASGVAFGVASQLTSRKGWIEAIYVALIITQLAYAASVVINHHIVHGDLALLMITVIGVSAGFPRRAAAVFTGYTVALMIGIGLLFARTAVLHDPTIVGFPVGLAISAAILVSAVRSSSMENRVAALVDQLTGLLNRNALNVRAADLEIQSATTGDGVAVVIMDIDHFKEVNDAHGHAGGDRVLVGVARRLRGQLRPAELPYRVGGEEFVVLLPGADLAAATDVAERLGDVVRRKPFGGVGVTVSLGVAASEPGEPFKFKPVLAQADAALYAAKRAGRDRACMAGLVVGEDQPMRAVELV
jgi:diguanylate cyclase (GGDEF)-like protein